MNTWKTNPVIVLLIAILLAVGVTIIATARQPGPDIQAIRAGDAPPVTVTAQATSNSTQAIPSATTSATAVAVSPTMPPPNQTPHPTAILIPMPSVVAQETSGWLGPTPNATEIARDELYSYITDKLVNEPATLVAAGTNHTPIPDEIFTGLSLTTYEVSEVTFPQQVSWEAWVGSSVTTVTFDRAWRVTVKGKGFPRGNSEWLMSSNNTLLGPCTFDNGGATTIVYDRELIPEGAKLGVSFGGSITYLPETLHFLPNP